MTNPDINPILGFLQHQKTMVLDGGLATALEAAGCNLDDDLWSARILLEEPEKIREAHRSFLVAGADCITTSSYQASFPGLRRRGLGEDEIVALLERSSELALGARDAFWSEPSNRAGRLRPLVAAGVGPYGAYLADGSEYTGRYGIDEDSLYEFHRERWRVLAGTVIDLLACETIPSRAEVMALLRVLDETPAAWAWISVSCRDEAHICDGTPIAEVASLCDTHPRVAAVGINCTAPDVIAPLIEATRDATSKPILVYPNSGEQYDVSSRNWAGKPDPAGLASAAAEWVALGAVAVGGCCRVLPGEIEAIRHRLLVESST